MNFNGVSEFYFLSNDYLDILFVGDEHSMYNPFEDDVLHNWIDTNITRSKNSYCIGEAEGLRADMASPMFVVPRYFDAPNTYFCDSIRFLLFHLFSPELYNYIYKQIKKYLSDLHNMTDTITLPAFPNIDLNNFEGIPTLENNNDFAMINANVINEIPSHLYGETNIPFELLAHDYNMDLSTYIYGNYYLILLHYMNLSFKYLVVRWIKENWKNNVSMPDLPSDESLWCVVNNWYPPYEPPADDTVTYLLCHLLDYVIITKILDLRNRTPLNIKQLIWIPAGNAHTIRIYEFFQKLFNFMKWTTVSRSIQNNDDFLKLIVDYPNIGLKEPVINPDPYIISFREMYKLKKTHTTVSKLLDAIFSEDRFNDNKEAFTLIKEKLYTFTDVGLVINIIALIQEKQVIGHFLRKELNILLARSKISTRRPNNPFSSLIRTSSYDTHLSGGQYKEQSDYVEFIPLFKVLFMPYTSINDMRIIKANAVTISSYINDPKNLRFDKLKSDISVLKIKANDNWQPISSKTIYYDYDFNYNKYLELRHQSYFDIAAGRLVNSLLKYASSKLTYTEIEYNASDAEKAELINNKSLDFWFYKSKTRKIQDDIIAKNIVNEAKKIDPTIDTSIAICVSYLTEVKHHLERYINVNLISSAYDATVSVINSYPFDVVQLSINDKAYLQDQFISKVYELFIEQFKSDVKLIISDKYAHKNKLFMAQIGKMAVDIYQGDIDLHDYANFMTHDVIFDYFNPTNEKIERLINDAINEVKAGISDVKAKYKSYLSRVSKLDVAAIDNFSNEFINIDHLVCELIKAGKLDDTESAVEPNEIYGGNENKLYIRYLTIILVSILIIAFIYLLYTMVISTMKTSYIKPNPTIHHMHQNTYHHYNQNNNYRCN